MHYGFLGLKDVELLSLNGLVNATTHFYKSYKEINFNLSNFVTSLFHYIDELCTICHLSINIVSFVHNTVGGVV